MITGLGWHGWPLITAMTAAAQILPCWFAMLADLGIAGADSVESPSTCMPFHGDGFRRLPVDAAPPVVRGDQPRLPRDVARAVRRHDVDHVAFDVVERELERHALARRRLRARCSARYSIMPLYCPFHSARKRPAFDVMSGLLSRTRILDFGFARLK